MSATAEQSAYNMETAKKNVLARLGYTWDELTEGTDASLDKRRAYNAELAREILKYPMSFTAQTVTSAEYTLAHPVSAAEDASFSLSDFAAEAVAPAGEALQSIGDGVFSVANAAKWAIPLLVGIYVFIQFRKLAK